VGDGGDQGRQRHRDRERAKGSKERHGRQWSEAVREIQHQIRDRRRRHDRDEHRTVPGEDRGQHEAKDQPQAEQEPNERPHAVQAAEQDNRHCKRDKEQCENAAPLPIGVREVVGGRRRRFIAQDDVIARVEIR
jgi:hypothetical protein